MPEAMTCDVCGGPVPESRAKKKSKRCSAGCAAEAERRRWRRIGGAQAEVPLTPSERSAVSMASVVRDLMTRGWVVYRAEAPGGDADMVVHVPGSRVMATVRVCTRRAYAGLKQEAPENTTKAQALAVVYPCAGPGDSDLITYVDPCPEGRPGLAAKAIA